MHEALGRLIQYIYPRARLRYVFLSSLNQRAQHSPRQIQKVEMRVECRRRNHFTNCYEGSVNLQIIIPQFRVCD